MNSKYLKSIRFSFGFLDVVMLNAVHATTMLLLNKIPADAEIYYLYLFIASNISWIVSAYFNSLYTNSASGILNFVKLTFRTFVMFNVLLLVFMFFFHYQYSRLYMICTFTEFLVIICLTRLGLYGLLKYLETSTYISKRIVIVGYNEIAKSLVERFSIQRKDYSVDGYFEDDKKVNELSILPVIGGIDECLEYAKLNDIKEIYATVSPEKYSGLYEMAKVAEKSLIRFKFVPDFRLYVNHNTHIEYMGEIPILSLRPEPLEDAGNAMKKRLFDIGFSLLVITCILTWLIPLIAILIKLTSKGPIFFVQQRSGKDNKSFPCIKFRTLRVNAEANTLQVTKDDERINKFGRFMRKTNLDELPQFFNVLKGDMSVVGPRPHMLNHTRAFSKILEEYMIRHFIKPGVTGWAQVNGYRGEIKEPEQLRKRIEHDIWYMENWSLWLDIQTMWLTIFNTIKGDENAY